MAQEIEGCQRVTVEAVVHAGGVLELHAAKATAEGAALVALQVT